MSKPPSVMVADDEGKLFNLFKKLLKGSGLNSVSFTDPRLTIEHFVQKQKMNSLVLDYLQTSGIEFTSCYKKLRKNVSDLKIFIMVSTS